MGCRLHFAALAAYDATLVIFALCAGLGSSLRAGVAAQLAVQVAAQAAQRSAA